MIVMMLINQGNDNVDGDGGHNWFAIVGTTRTSLYSTQTEADLTG